MRTPTNIKTGASPAFAGLKAALIVTLVALCALLCSCSEKQADPTGSALDPSFTTSAFNLEAIEGSSKAGIDASHLNEGYVGAIGHSPNRLKLQVTHENASYNYDLASNGEPSIYPLNMGNGTYTFTIFQNTSGSRYVPLFSTEHEVSMPNDKSPFLVPSFYCDFTKNSACVKAASDLAAQAKNQADYVRLVYSFVSSAIAYDNEKARRVASSTNYVPNPDQTLASGKGICFDYASLTAAMLRSQGIPTKIVTGSVSTTDIYHAWNMVFVDGTWKAVGVTVKANEWSLIDTTLGASSTPYSVDEKSTYSERYTY